MFARARARLYFSHACAMNVHRHLGVHILLLLILFL